MGQACTMTATAYDVRGVVKTYRGGVPANAGIDLQVAPGEMFGILGPNGAGKSTLVRQLAGLLRPDSGTISLFDRDIVGDRRLAAGFVAYLAQDEPALADLPVRVAVETTARLRGTSRREAARAGAQLLDELDLGSFADRPLRRLSGGQRRLACVAATLAADRPVLILDEPTTGLDPLARRSVWSALRRRRDSSGVTVVLVTHNVVEAETVLDRVAIVDRGRVIACDTPGRLKARVSDEVRLDLVWRAEPPMHDSAVAELFAVATVQGTRWTARLDQATARSMLGRLMTGAAMVALDDFTLATPSLEEVYLALGGRDDDMERA
jgi:ABC-2 type transport system ATP-binding protein